MTQPARAVLPRITPIAPSLRPQAFNGSAWLFEPKYDGFRGVVYLTSERCSIYSKRGNRFARFSELERRLCGAFPKRSVILDGEVVAFGADGRVSFWDLMRGQGTLGYVAFDLLWSRGRDLRGLPLIERKKRLARIIPAQTGIVCSTLTIDEHGKELFDAACGLDLEGIVAKRKTDPYDDRTRWLKVKNPAYSQAEGRRELFEGWGTAKQ
jgi:bifunctional non-homologous end joining protein LigD